MCINYMKEAAPMGFGLISSNDMKTEQNAVDLDQLLDEIAGGDSQALAALYHSTSAAIYAFALSVLKNAQDAEDVLHDSYLNIYSAAPDYRSCGRPMAWILTIARNLCLLKLRERKKRADIPAEDWEPYLESRESVSPEDRLILQVCMNHLSDEERQIVVLHAVAGFKHREIAELTGYSLTAVLSKYSRALKKLKQYLEKED